MLCLKTGALACILALSAAVPVPAAADARPPETSAAAYIVTEAGSGAVLAGENAEDPVLIASTTKIMTALLAIESCELDEPVAIRPEWTGIEGSSMYLRAGETYTVRELLYGLLLASGNDAAQALACIAAGSAEAFVDRMNERAEALGCDHTHFSNPSGLDAEDHYSTAHDLARIMACAIQNEAFCEICGCASKTIGENTLVNHNRLLTECEGVFAGKTGYTQAAGRTLVSCCSRKGVELICVTLSDPDDWADHEALFDWAYDLYEERTLLDGGEQWVIPVIGGTAEETAAVPAAPLRVYERTDDPSTLAIKLPAFVYAPIRAGDTAGYAIVLRDGVQTDRIALVMESDVPAARRERITLWDRLRTVFGNGEREIYTLE